MGYSVHRPGDPLNAAMFPDDAIFIFDFDGVLIEQCEEKIFRLPERQGEREQLEVLADRVFIDHRLYNTNYLRHLVYQAMTEGRPCVPYKPVLSLANELEAAARPYFIMTARSGLYALQRMHRFIETQVLFPQEVFCLGRASKAALIADLLDEWDGRHIVFLDDSMYHIEAAARLECDDLTVVKVEHPRCTAHAESLVALHLGRAA